MLAKLWYGAAQSVSEAAGSPFVKTFTLNGTAEPDFSSNAGYFFSTIIKNPIASQSQKLPSCIVESITVTFSPDQGGRATVTATIITGRGFSEVSNPTGANAHSTVTVPSFYNSTHTLSIGGIDVTPYSVSYTFENTIAMIGDTAGLFENYNINAQKLSCNAVVKWDPNSDGLRALRGGAAQDFAHTIGSSGSAGYWNVAGTGVARITDAPEDRSSADSDHKLNLAITLKPDSTNTNYPAVAMADGVDQAW